MKVGKILGRIKEKYGLRAAVKEALDTLPSAVCYFTSTGAILLRQQIKFCDKIGSPVFLDQIGANARGYGLLYRAARVGR